MQEKQRLIC